ncbi:MAG: hypothetical protein P9L94_17140 [Candidatus Hinthialibacter antarcticus]|nr:hypothetical protein [Candidatus Hinthialibacter antarcticus]
MIRNGIFGLLCLVVLMLVSCSGDLAPDQEEEEPRLLVAVVTGFDPEYPFRRSGEWASLTVNLKNNGPEIAGDFLVKFKEGSQRYRTPIELPSQARRQFDIPVHTPEFLDELEFYIETARETIPIELITIGTILDDTHRIIAVMSEERGSHGYMAQSDQLDIDIVRHLLYTSPTILPQWWPGYRSLDVLMWDGGETAAINTRQQQALDDWVQMGGTLILAAGSNWQELSTSGFRLYIPLNLTGSRVVEAGTTLDATDGQASPDLARQMVIATSEMIDDPNTTVWLKAGDSPFVVERKWGAGRIVFCAGSLDGPLFEDPNLQETFLQFITDSPAPITPQVITQLDNYVDGFLRWDFQAELPSTKFIAMYLGLYIILVVPVNYLIFRRIGRLEWAWFTVPIWAIVFAVGVYYIGALRQQSSVTVNQISIVESRPNAKTAPSSTYCAIYSPVRKWYEIRFSSPAAFPLAPERQNLMGRPQNNLSEEIINVHYEETDSFISDYLIHHWSQRVFKGLHTVSLGDGVDIDTSWEDGKLRGSITNNTGKTLEKATLMASNWYESWTSLSPGQTVEITAFTRNNEQNFNRFNQMGMGMYGSNFQEFKNDPARMIREHLSQAYSANLLNYHESQGLGVFTALIREPQLEFEINDEMIEPKGNTLLSVVFPYYSQPTGETTLTQLNWKIVQGMNRLSNNRIQGRMKGMPSGNNQYINIQTGMEDSWALRSTTPIKGAEIISMNLRITYSDMMNNQVGGNVQPAPQVEPEFELHFQDQATKKYFPLSQITDDNGDVFEPSRFLNTTLGAIQCQMKAPNNRPRNFNLHELNMQIQLKYRDSGELRFLGREIVEPPKLAPPDFEAGF